MTETEAFIALNMIPRIGPVRVRRLLEAFGSPQAILSASASKLEAVQGIGAEVVASLVGWESKVNLDEEIARVEAFGAHVVTVLSPGYPAALKEIHDPPIVLYVWGTLQERDRHAVGVVGARKPSLYAAECSRKLSYQLASAGITVVSGLARGIDTAAHHGALAAKGRTIAVIGSGLLALYPPENAQLAEKIITSGAVISEFSMEVTADRQTFPMRNRIISGLSFGLLVVEAGARSGALISAAQAGDQGRALYAVPGRIDSPHAMGSNKLLQNGAKLITCAEDILDDMGILFAEKPQLIPAPAPDLSGDEAAVYAALAGEESHMDDIADRCGLPIHVVSSTLLALEMKKLVRQRPGGRFASLR